MSEADIFIEATLDVEGTPLRVLRYDLNESLSELSMLDCEAMEDDAEPKPPSELCGKNAELKLRRTDGAQERAFVGRVVRAERLADADDVRTLHLRIAPVPWSLKKRSDCRVFQKQTVVDIAKEVLDKAGVPSDQQQWDLTGNHAARDYCVQYRETDLEFLLRILSEEGIYFAVRHKDGKDVVAFGDDPTGLGDAPDPKSLPFRHAAGFDELSSTVLRVRQVLSVTPDKVMLRDYNPHKPKVKLEGTVESSDEGEHALEIYDYPARAAEPADAKRLAEVLLHEVELERDRIEGETGTLTLEPGLRFAIEQHPYEPLNREYIVTSVTISGSSPRLGGLSTLASGVEGHECRCVFTAVPKTTALVPARRPRAADMVGLQTALTTGPSGEEIHVSDKGEVTIRYPWDRLGPTDDGSSAFARTLQLPLGDSMLLPRVGWEVSVDHLEGDPDRPLIMGRMYNGVTLPPYALPDNAAKSALQTATSPGGGSFNEMRTADTKGSEEMFFNASKDMAVDVKNNTTESVGNNSSRSIGSNHKKDVTNSSTASIGANQTVSVGADQRLKVETQLQEEIGGDHSLSIGGNRDMKVGGDHQRTVGGDSTLEVGGNQIDLVVGSVTDETLANYTHKVGAALIDITVADRSLMVGGNATEKAGAAKVIAVAGARAVEIGGTMMQKVAGAIINVANADRNQSAGASYTEVAAGAQIVKADNIIIEGDDAVTLVMGGTILSLVPAAVTFMGVSLKLDGPTADLGALILDN